MKIRKITIRICSDSGDFNPLISKLSLIFKGKTNISIENNKEDFSFQPDDIALCMLKTFNQKIHNKIIKAKNLYNNQIIFVIDNKNPLITSTIAKLGFTEIYTLPDELLKFENNLKEIVKNLQLKISNEEKYNISTRESHFASIIGCTKDASRLIAAARSAAENSSVNVLILGETGTGKGMLANAIHNYSMKIDAPFVEVVCSAIPEHLLESELFGHEKGAFTDAKTKKLGLFELANNGTIFLDEIGELNLNLQSKLLRVIEKKVIRRVGGSQDIPVNARIISATHRNLKQMILDDQFRMDLYYRLNLITIELTPLRERVNDIVYLAENFVAEFVERYGKKIKKIDNSVIEFISSYRWPGNVRELKNILERGVLLCENSSLTLKDIEVITQTSPNPFKASIANKNSSEDDRLTMNFLMSEVDMQHLSALYAKEVLIKVDGNKTKAARILNISRPKLNRLLSN
jgi:two-component system, NtrC family, response regulator AtoC